MLLERGRICAYAMTHSAYDAKASVSGMVLIDLLLGRPNLMNSLPSIIMQFRTKKIAFMRDIASYFHRVHVDLRDADVCSYFWFRDESLEEVDLFRFKAHLFGSGASSVVT